MERSRRPSLPGGPSRLRGLAGCVTDLAWAADLVPNLTFPSMRRSNHIGHRHAITPCRGTGRLSLSVFRLRYRHPLRRVSAFLGSTAFDIVTTLRTTRGTS